MESYQNFYDNMMKYDEKEARRIERFLLIFMIAFPIATGLGMGLAIWMGEGTRAA